MRCEILTEFSQLQRLSTVWRSWVSPGSGADAFQLWEWIEAYWEAYGGTPPNDRAVWCPVVYEGHDPVAILPLARKQRGLTFLSSPWSDYNDILSAEHCGPAVLETAFDAMLRDPADWKVCCLDCLSSGSRIIRYLKTIPRPFRQYVQLLESSPSPTILLDEEPGQILKQLAGKDQLKRYHRKLSKLGCLKFRHLETQAEVQAHLDTFFHQHITRWAVAGIKSEFLSAEHRNFYRAMAGKLNSRAELRFGVLELNTTPIAYHFGFEVNRKLTWYKPAFDIRWSDFSPGIVLLRCLFEYAERAGLTEFDFSRGAEPYKYRYCNHVKKAYMICIERRPRCIASCVRQIERRTRESIRKHPSLAKAIRHIPAMLRFSSFRLCSIDLTRTLSGAFRQLVWSRTTAAVFHCTGTSDVEPTAIRAPGESLETMATLLIEWPELLDQAELLQAGERLKGGDRMLALTCPGNRFPLIVWLGKRNELSLPVTGGRWRMDLPAESRVINDIWLAPGSSYRCISSDVLLAVLKQSHGAEHWIVCSDALPVSQSSVEAAGFQLRKRVFHWALFHWLGNTRISEPETKNAGGLEASNA